jgi:hypothetical protein
VYLTSKDKGIKNDDKNEVIKHILFCNNCPSIESEGSLIFSLIAKYSKREYSIKAELVYCVPNYADQPRILNTHQFKNRVVLIDRGKNAIQEKISKIANTGALAVIIADDGQCNFDFSFCGKRVTSYLCIISYPSY